MCIAFLQHVHVNLTFVFCVIVNCLRFFPRFLPVFLIYALRHKIGCRYLMKNVSFKECGSPVTAICNIWMAICTHKDNDLYIVGLPAPSIKNHHDLSRHIREAAHAPWLLQKLKRRVLWCQRSFEIQYFPGDIKVKPKL